MLGYHEEELLGVNMHERLHHTHTDGQHYPADQCPIFLAFREGVPCRIDSDVLRRIADPAALTCPHCSGVLSKVRDAKPLRFRCQVGHAYTAEVVAKEQENAVDEALRVARRIGFPVLLKATAGGGGTITNGDTQWMTAGAGVLHVEKPPESLVVSGGLFHGIQLWVNLPRTMKWAQPRYQDIRARGVALLARCAGLLGHLVEEQTHPVGIDIYMNVDRNIDYQPPK